MIFTKTKQIDDIRKLQQPIQAKLAELEPNLTWKEIINELSKIKVDASLKATFKELLDNWSKDTDENFKPDYSSLDLILAREISKAKKLEQYSKELNKPVEEIADTFIKGKSPIYQLSVPDFWEFEHTIIKAYSRYNFNTEEFTPYNATKILRDYLVETKLTGDFTLLEASKFYYFGTDMVRQSNKQSMKIWHKLLDSIIENTYPGNPDHLTVEKVIEILDERLSYGDFEKKSAEENLNSFKDLEQKDVEIPLDLISNKLFEKAWKLHKLQENIYAFAKNEDSFIVQKISPKQSKIYWPKTNKTKLSEILEIINKE